MNTAIPAAGWYEDLNQPGQERFWTGQAWGAETRPLGFKPSIPPGFPVPDTELRSDLRARRSPLGKRLAWIVGLFS